MEQVRDNSLESRKAPPGWPVVRNPAIMMCLVAGLGLSAQRTSRAAAAPLEYQVKAAFLLNFTKFVEWPSSAFATPDSPLAICILGGDPFGGALDQIVEGEVVNGRKLVIKRLTHAPPPKTCQVLFAAKSEKDIANILAAVGPGVLTVGEGESFLRDGGIIAFVIEDRRVRFDIKETAAAHAGLKLSSKLMNVARFVEK